MAIADEIVVKRPIIPKRRYVVTVTEAVLFEILEKHNKICGYNWDGFTTELKQREVTRCLEFLKIMEEYTGVVIDYQGTSQVPEGV